MQNERKLAGAVLELAFRDYIDHEDPDERAQIKRELLGEPGALFCGLCCLSNEDIFPKLENIAAEADRQRRKNEEDVWQFIVRLGTAEITRKLTMQTFRKRGLKNHETARALAVLTKQKRIRMTGGRIDIRKEEKKK